MRWLDLASTLMTLLAASAVVVWLGTQWLSGKDRPTVPIPTAPVALDTVVLYGSADAHLAVIAFSDFQCPFCGTFARESMRNLMTEFADSGRAQVGFVQYPIESIHKEAFRAAEAALCAARQGRFWEMHDLLFADQNRLDEPSLFSRANELDLAPQPFAVCMDGEVAADVRAGIGTAKALGLRGTPAFVVGRIQPGGQLKVTRIVSGADSYPEIVRALDAAAGGRPVGLLVAGVGVPLVAVGAVVAYRRRHRSRPAAESIP